MIKVLAALVVVPFGLGFLAAPADRDGLVAFTFQDPEIIESSGLVARGDRFVTVNDSGDGARVFVVDPSTGETTARVSWSADPHDLEALAPMPDGDVLVGDIGDNTSARDTITVTRVPLDAGQGDATVDATSYELSYPGGPRDAETLMVHPRTGQVLVASKEFIGRLYAAPERLSAERPNRLRRLGDVMPIATDGAFFPDGEHFVLRDYGDATFYTWPGLEVVGEVELPPQEQGEGIAVDKDGEVYLSSEGQYADVLRVRLPERLRAEIDGSAADRGGDTGSGDDPVVDSSVGVAVEERSWWPWLIGGFAGALIVVVLLRSLRPR